MVVKFNFYFFLSQLVGCNEKNFSNWFLITELLCTHFFYFLMISVWESDRHFTIRLNLKTHKRFIFIIKFFKSYTGERIFLYCCVKENFKTIKIIFEFFFFFWDEKIWIKVKHTHTQLDNKALSNLKRNFLWD